MRFTFPRIYSPPVLIVVALALAWSIVVSPLAWAWPQTGVPVSLDSGNQTMVSIAPDGHGGVFTLWVNTSIRSTNNPLFFAQHLSPGGARTWGKSGVQVATPIKAQIQADMVADGQGGILVGILDGDQDVNTLSFEVIVQRLSGSGKKLWGDSGIDVATERLGGLAVAADGSGGAIVSFGSATEVRLLAQHLGADGSFLWARPGVPLTNGTAQTNPMAVSDGSGGAVIAWIQYPALTGGIQRLSGAGSRLWSDDGIALAQRLQVLVSDAEPAFFLGDLRKSATGQDAFVRKLDASGAEIWTPGGAPVSQAEGAKEFLQLAVDGNGGAFLSWAQDVVYAQHLNASGAPVWATNGVPVSPPEAGASWNGIAPDGADGVFVIYEPLLGDGSLDLAVQHLGSDGRATGAPSTLAHMVWYPPLATSDDRGNAFLAWSEYSGYFYLEPAHGFLTRLSDPSQRGDGKLSPTLPSLATSRIGTIEPNPARGVFRASGVLPGDTPAHAELFDPRGRVVASRLIVPIGGAWAVSFGASDHLASGTYVLRIVQGDAVLSAKVSMIR